MQIFNILKYKVKIIIRTSFEVSANAVRKKFKDNINSSLLYILAFCFQIQNAMLLCYGLSLLGKILCYYLAILACVFMLLSSYITGKKIGMTTSIMDDNDVLLTSDINNIKMFFLISIEQFIREFIDDIVLIIPTIFLIFYASNKLISSIFYSFTILILNILVYLIFYLFSYMKKNNQINIYNTAVVYISEIWSVLKYIILTILGYFIAGFLFLHIDLKNLSLNEKLGHLNFVYKEKFFIIIDSVKTYIFSFEINTSLFIYIGIISVLLLIILVFIGGNIIDIKYLTQTNKNKNKKCILVERYLQIIEYLERKLFGDRIYIKKDLSIIKRNSSLLINNAMFSMLFPVVNCVNLGILVFLTKNNFTRSRNIFIIIFLFLSLIDMVNQIKTVLFPFIIPNGEMKNILLFKNAGTSIGELAKSKNKLMHLLMIIPYSVLIVELIIYAIAFKLNILILIIMLLYSIIVFKTSSKVLLCSDLLYNRYNYNSYEQLYENIYEVKMFSKISRLLKEIYIIPLFLIFILSVFNIYYINEVYIIILSNLYMIIIYMISNKINKIGVGNFDKENIQLE
ncbi:hypothetical protein G9F73_019650 [Clostridium estertheticum]|uniref:hypothetical protein n=1 Tax=Clostridium estertheticum TaxID=238834 RepID=UPI0013EECA8C|nr:hypothetical protein [Clostridium estertheticum]MBZ9609942.1 hypothetical protein [Clostridium estertheticum]